MLPIPTREGYIEDWFDAFRRASEVSYAREGSGGAETAVDVEEGPEVKGGADEKGAMDQYWQREYY